MTLAPHTPAGWHPDPSGKPALRWWDGINWTEQIAPLPPPNGTYAPGSPQTKTNGMAVASLVLGILWIWSIGSILAIISGEVARHQIKNSHGTQTGRGMALAGRVLGAIGLVLPITMIILSAVGRTA